MRGVLKQRRTDLVLGQNGIADMMGRVEYKASVLSDDIVLECRLNQQVERGRVVCVVFEWWVSEG